MKPGDLQWENARITRTLLGFQDRGILTVGLTCQDHAGSQGFGGRNLSAAPAFRNFVVGVLKVIGADGWESVQDSLVRIGRAERNGLILAIRPILDNWPVFMPTDELLVDSGLIESE